MNIFAVLSAFRSSQHAGPVGGGEISNRQLLEKLAERGHAVTVYAFNAGADGGRADGDVHVVDGGLGRPGGAIKSIFRAARTRERLGIALSGCRPDVILTSAGTVGSALYLSKRCRAPVAVMVRAVRDMQPPKGSPLKRVAKRLVYGGSYWTQAPYLIANSRFLLDHCRQNGFGGVGWVVYPPVDVEIAAGAWPSRVRSIGMVGNSSQKGIEVFLMLAAKLPEIGFKVIGDRSVAPGTSILSNNVTRVGWTNDPVAEIDTCDALLMPTQFDEAFGRAAVEAVRRKKFVIASRLGGLPEAVGDPALLVDPTDFEGWHRKVSRLISNPEEFVQPMCRAVEVAKSFELAAQVEGMEEAIRGMIVDSAGQS